MAKLPRQIKTSSHSLSSLVGVSQSPQCPPRKTLTHCFAIEVDMRVGAVLLIRVVKRRALVEVLERVRTSPVNEKHRSHGAVRFHSQYIILQTLSQLQELA